MVSKKRLPLFVRIIICIPLFILLIFVLVVSGINVGKFIFYHDFYSFNTDMSKIPGLSSGAVQQGITVDKNDNYVMATYMKDGKSPSRIYLTDDKTTRFVELYEDDAFTIPSTTHTGGIQYVESLDSFYLTLDGNYLSYFTHDELFSSIKINVNKNKVEIFTSASFVFSDDEYLYVGEFHKDGTPYICEHEITYNGIKHHSLIASYKITASGIDFNKPSKLFSIIDLVQGCAVKDNHLYLSTSWGLSSSRLYRYNLDKAVKVDDYIEGVDTYFVSEVKASLKCPPMLEDLDVDSKGRIITYTEAASNKYIFGKFFFMNKVYAIKY